MEYLAALKSDPKARLLPLDSHYRPSIWLGHALALKPKSIADEPIERHRSRKTISRIILISFQGQISVRAGNLRRGPVRPQEHTGWHIAFPKRHRFAKHPHIQALHRAQMRGSR